jgi:hypothetical protein
MEPQYYETVRWVKTWERIGESSNYVPSLARDSAGYWLTLQFLHRGEWQEFTVVTEQ